MSLIRLDQSLVSKGLVSTRSQGENYIKLGRVTVNAQTITKAGFLVRKEDDIKMTAAEQYVSRAGLKLSSVAKSLQLNFNGKTVLDVGSSTGGFTDYALQHGALQVIAVDVGTDQLHPTLRNNPRVELHEKTDIRSFQTPTLIDIVVIDVSFISLREVLPHVAGLLSTKALVVAMVKPQFEAGDGVKHKGVIKNDAMRRNILRDFENWVKSLFVIVDKADSGVSGAKGNTERFYLLKPLQKRS